MPTDLNEYCHQKINNNSIDIFADGLEDPYNARALVSCAELFDARAFLRDRFGLRQRLDPMLESKLLPSPGLDAVRSSYDRVLTIELAPSASNLFDYHPPQDGEKIAVFVGNERHGVEKAVRRVSDQVLQIPMRGNGVDSLNVVTSAVISGHHLQFGRSNPRLPRRTIRRPELVMVNPADPAELGTSLRTAWTLGWDRVFLQDDFGVWFTRDRAVYAAGRGAARRHRNPIHVVRVDNTRPLFETGIVVTSDPASTPLREDPALRSRDCAVIIPSTTAVPLDPELLRIARRYVYVGVCGLAGALEHYRLTTGVVLSELMNLQG